MSTRTNASMKVWTTSSIDALTNTVVSYGARHSMSLGIDADSCCILARTWSAVSSALPPGRR